MPAVLAVVRDAEHAVSAAIEPAPSVVSAVRRVIAEVMLAFSSRIGEGQHFLLYRQTPHLLSKEGVSSVFSYFYTARMLKTPIYAVYFADG